MHKSIIFCACARTKLTLNYLHFNLNFGIVQKLYNNLLDVRRVSMRKVFLLTGFQNWGKTWLIQKLFSRKRFSKDVLYGFNDHLFCVMPMSNDDLGKEGYEHAYHKRMEALRKGGIKPAYIFSAFCPTKEDSNRSADIIRDLYSTDQIVLIPIEQKWCNHATLKLNELEEYYSAFKNIIILPLSQKDPTRKLPELQGIVRSCLP